MHCENRDHALRSRRVGQTKRRLRSFMSPKQLLIVLAAICTIAFTFSIHRSRKRLIELQRSWPADGKPYRAFDVYNLGRYERQWWQKERLHGADDEHRRVVLGFYKAEPLPSPTALLHGRKGRALVHVDAIDSNPHPCGTGGRGDGGARSRGG